jgi:hypothetical protein
MLQVGPTGIKVDRLICYAKQLLPDCAEVSFDSETLLSVCEVEAG